MSHGPPSPVITLHDRKSFLILSVGIACRVLQIKDLVRDCLRQKEIEVKIEATTREEPAPLLLKRSACVDASAFSPLRKMVSRRQRPDKTGVIITTQTDEFGTKEQVQVLIRLHLQRTQLLHMLGICPALSSAEPFQMLTKCITEAKYFRF